MLRKLSQGLFIGALLAVAACGSARLIQRSQTGAVYELHGDRTKAMQQADQEMAGFCGPGNFTVVQEGEEAIGTDTYAREDTTSDSATSKSGRRSATDTTTTAQQSTRTATAWRVHYQCGGAAVGGPPQPMPPEPMPPQPMPPQPMPPQPTR